MRGNTQTTTVARRSRRRMAAWLAFAAVGVSMGAVWATGFASVGGSTNSNNTSNSAPLTSAGASGQATQFPAGTITAVGPLAVDWTGRWGSVPDTVMFKVDLSGKSASNNYNVAFLLTNGPAVSSGHWTSLQLLVENVTSGGASCTASDFDGTKRQQLMNFDTQDAGVYWNNLPGGAVYCIGLNASDGMQSGGTFLRRDDDTSTVTYPQFVTTVDRAQ